MQRSPPRPGRSAASTTLPNSLSVYKTECLLMARPLSYGCARRGMYKNPWQEGAVIDLGVGSGQECSSLVHLLPLVME